MAHELATHSILDEVTGTTIQRASIAYTGTTPWHGLGQPLTPDAPFEVWLKESGMTFLVESKPVLWYNEASDMVHQFPDRVVLSRSDNNKPLSIVSTSYKVVQPHEVLQSQFDICNQLGAKMETAGVLFDGKRFWSLSNLGDQVDMGGGDQIGGYILIATAVDGTLATTVRRTTVRVVCNNTLSMAVNGNVLEAKIPHSVKYSLDKVKEALGIHDDHDDQTDFMDQCKEMTKFRLSSTDAVKYFAKVFAKDRQQKEQMDAAVDAFIPGADIMDDLLSGKWSSVEEEQLAIDVTKNTDAKSMQVVYELWSGQGKGSTLSSSNHTLWGAVNAVTEFQDHHRGAKTVDSRLNKAWFGQGELVKRAAYDDALSIIQSL